MDVENQKLDKLNVVYFVIEHFVHNVEIIIDKLITQYVMKILNNSSLQNHMNVKFVKYNLNFKTI